MFRRDRWRGRWARRVWQPKADGDFAGSAGGGAGEAPPVATARRSGNPWSPDCVADRPRRAVGQGRGVGCAMAIGNGSTFQAFGRACGVASPGCGLGSGVRDGGSSGCGVFGCRRRGAAHSARARAAAAMRLKRSSIWSRSMARLCRRVIWDSVFSQSVATSPRSWLASRCSRSLRWVCRAPCQLLSQVPILLSSRSMAGSAVFGRLSWRPPAGFARRGAGFPHVVGWLRRSTSSRVVSARRWSDCWRASMRASVVHMRSSERRGHGSGAAIHRIQGGRPAARVGRDGGPR